MSNTKKMIITGLCISLGIVLPMTLHSIPNAGSIFLPLHFTVLICGLTCGPIYGGISGVLTTLLSHLLTGMPPVFILPSMMAELAAYGLIAGLMIKVVHTKNSKVNVLAALVVAMLLGRIVYGLMNSLIFQVGTYSLEVWIAGAFVTALPGIIIQIALIPFIVNALNKTLKTNEKSS